MVPYEITAVVREDLQIAYEQFMTEQHVPDVLATGEFAGSSFARSEPGRYRIRYEAWNREALDRYLAEHAPRLRQHFLQTFPEGIEVTREEWTVLAIWP